MTRLLRVESVSRRYGPRVGVPAVTLEAGTGSCIGVVGPNGAGKTTLLRIVAGLLRPSTGIVTLADGIPRRYYGGESTLPPAAVAKRWARAVGRIVVAERRTIGRLSRGTRQLLGLRTVLSGEGASVVLLDEPWEGLDLDAARWLTAEIRRVKERGSALLVSSHRLHDLAEVADGYVFLDGATARPVAAADLACRGGAGVIAMFDQVRQDRR